MTKQASKNSEYDLEISSEDTRYPALVRRNKAQASVYGLHVDTLTISRTCNGHAHCERGCVCGARDTK